MTERRPSPPDGRGRLSALLRLWPFARPYRGLVALTFAGGPARHAGPAGRPADHRGGRRRADRRTATAAGLVPLLALALVFGIAEAALFFLRRWAMNQSCLQLERDLRDTLYQRLQRLPVAFHDRWASGQLLSRATTDVSTVRRFVGFGAVFLVVNLVTCVVVLAPAAGHLLAAGPGGAAHHGAAVLPRRCAGSGGTTSQSRRVQDQQGELTTDVEEAVQGIRVVKSLGRSGLVFGRYDAQGDPAARLELEKVRTLALLWCVFEFHPQLTLALILVGGVAGGEHAAR